MEPKIKVQAVSSVERKIEVEIPVQAIEAEMENRFGSLAKTVRLKGFRPGHVPLDVVKAQFYHQVEGESLSRLVDKSYEQAISNEKLVPVSHPKIEAKPREKGKPFNYIAHVEIKPAVEVKHYKDLPLEKQKGVISDERVNQTIDQLRESKAALKVIEAPQGVGDKDFVVIDFKGKLDGKVFPGGTAQNLLYEMGSKRFVEGFEAGLLGMKPSETKKIDVTFPADFHEKKLAGKPVQFEVTLREIKSKEVPPLNDDFAKEIPDCKTVAELKAKVRKDLEETEEREARQKMEKALYEVLVEKNPFQVPPSMVARQEEHLKEDAKSRLQQMGLQGKRLDETLETWMKDIKTRAEFDVKVILLCEAIIQKEKLEVSENDVNNELEILAKRANLPLAKVKAYYQEKGAVSQIKWQLLQRKGVDWLLSHAKIKNK